MQKIALSLLMIFSLQACTTLDAYTQEEKTSKSTNGALIGAAIGALIGIATSDNKKERKERALKGAGIGAITGGSVGYYMDQQEAELRKELEATGVSVTRDGDNIILNMPGNITFATNVSDLKAEFVPVLGSVAKVLEKYKSTMIEVAGHTDSRGSDAYNLNLSKQRALSVGQVLASKNVQDVRMDIVGYGETSPIASNDTAAGRAENRRVSLTLLPFEE